MEDDVVVPESGNTQDDAEFLGTDVIESESETEELDQDQEEDEDDQEDQDQDDKSQPELDKTKEVKENPEVKALTATLQSYEEVFATPEEAKEAASKSQFFDNLDRAVMSGNAEVLVSLIQENDPAALQSFSKNFLPALEKANRAAYFEVTAPVIRRVLRASFSQAQSSGNKDLENGIKHLSKFLFNRYDVPEETQEEPNPEKEKFQEERSKHYDSLNREYASSIKNAIGSEAEKLILEGLDPNGVMTDRMKGTVIQDTIQSVLRVMKDDRVFQNKMNSMMKRAIDNGRKREDALGVFRFYLARFKALMPAARSAARKEVLPKRKTEQSSNKTQKPNTPQGTAPKRDTSKVKANEVDWSKTSPADFLNDRVVMKK